MRDARAPLPRRRRERARPAPARHRPARRFRERRTFDAAGRIVPALADYAAAVRSLAAEQKVPLIDLNADRRTIYEALDPALAPLAFNDGGADHTHHDNCGAWLLASVVAERIRAALPAIAPHVTMARFDPAHPPRPAAFAIPPSVARSAVRPAGS